MAMLLIEGVMSREKPSAVVLILVKLQKGQNTVRIFYMMYVFFLAVYNQKNNLKCDQNA